MRAQPRSRIVRVAVDGSGAETVWEEKCWVGHVNTSPTQPNLLTFCHEGPWHLVDHRIWVLDLDSGKAWKVRQRDVEGETIGHEYWHRDGVHIGYHGHAPGRGSTLGAVRYDDTSRTEAAFPHRVMHIHSNDLRLIVGDGDHTVKLFRFDGQRFEPPRVLCEHWCSPFVQVCHVHPCFNGDARRVLFATDCSGYGNVFLAEVPDDITSLPLKEAD
jgi:oligogalacturonide lyase